MITLNQVELLEQKVESAVEKIQQLQAENDALRKKCSELTNAISVKSEQLTSFESEQSQIENGIKKALERLNSIENSVLKATSQVSSTQTIQNTNSEQQVQQSQISAQNVQQIPSFDKLENVSLEKEPKLTPEISIPKENPINNIQNTENSNSFSNENSNENNDFSESDESDDFAEDENQDGLGFDIF